MAAEYMACGNPTSDHADFWGVGNTSWCNNSTFTSSDCSQITQGFSDYPLPLFIANYSCLSFTSDISNQKFEEVRTTYGPKMTSVWSGRIVSGWMGVDDGDDYSVAFNGTIPYYGLVLVFNNTIEIKQNYKALSTHLASINPSTTKLSFYTPMSPDWPPCPSQNTTWGIAIH